MESGSTANFAVEDAITFTVAAGGTYSIVVEGSGFLLDAACNCLRAMSADGGSGPGIF